MLSVAAARRRQAADTGTHRVVRDEEANVGIAEHGRDADQAGTATRDDAHVLPGVLAGLALAVVLVVELGNGLAKRLDATSRSILAAVDRDVNGLGLGEGVWDLVVDLGGTLAQVGPVLRRLLEAALAGTLGAPDDAGRSTRGVEACMRAMALVSLAELLVDLRLELWPRLRQRCPSETRRRPHTVLRGILAD